MKLTPILILVAYSWLGLVATIAIPKVKANQVNTNCPEDVETLTQLLLKDFPSYANRVRQRARQFQSNLDPITYVIVAGKPEFEPLPLQNNQYDPIYSENPQQIFFTTLERQYINNQVIESQNYYWLFLTQSATGPRLVMLFSRLGSSNPNLPPSPPRESTNSTIGQAIQLWLRDCRADAIKKEKGQGKIN